MRLGTDVAWDNVPSMVHVTSLEAVQGILKVGIVRAMGQQGGRNAVMLAPISQADPRAIAGMVHEGRGLNYEVHLDVASMMRRDEVVYVSFSGSLNIMNDVHYTEITHVTLLHAGDKVVVYDRDAHEIFPHGAVEITTEAWADAQESEIPDCTSVADVVREPWRGVGSGVHSAKPDSAQGSSGVLHLTAGCSTTMS